jgi:uncharacterized membrane protein HdeD (DUF308 family)
MGRGSSRRSSSASAARRFEMLVNTRERRRGSVGCGCRFGPRATLDSPGLLCGAFAIGPFDVGGIGLGYRPRRNGATAALRRVTELVARRLAWWAVVLLGVACVCLGAVLTADPSLSLSALDWLVGAALIVTGVSELAFAGVASRPRLSRVVAVVWIAAGIIAVSWSGISVRTLAVVVGVGLIVGGLVKVSSALFGEADERFVVALSGVTNVVVGVLALSWPGVTVLVLAVLLGVRTVLFGFGQVALGLRLRGAPPGEPVAARRWPRWLRVIGTTAVLGVAGAGAVVSAAIDRAAPNAPGAFYTAPSPLPAGPPGTIIRSELIDGFHASATAYRVLYKSTGYDGPDGRCLPLTASSLDWFCGGFSVTNPANPTIDE